MIDNVHCCTTEHAATKNEVEKPEQMLAQELKGKSLLAVLTETMTLGYSENRRRHIHEELALT